MSFVQADSYIGLELTQIDTKSQAMEKDTVFIMTLGGLNLDKNGKYYQMTTWEINYGFGSKTHQKINNQEYAENQVLMFGLNLPLTDTLYAKIGAGKIWSQVTDSNGNSSNKETRTNVRLGLGYMVSDSITIQSSYHTGFKNISFGVGFLF
jgi:hypothetical protein